MAKDATVLGGQRTKVLDDLSGVAVGDRVDVGRPASPARRSLAEGLALVGVAFLVWQAWTLFGWATHHPHQITIHRVHNGRDFWVPVVYEAFSVVMAVGVLSYLFRKRRRDGQIGLEGQIVVAGLAAAWLDLFPNFFQPIFSYGTNWVNINYPGGYAPFMLNPVAKDNPWPIFVPMVFAFGLLPMALAVCFLLRRIRARHPSVSTARLVLLILAFGFVMDLCMEIPLYWAHAFNWWGMPNVGVLWITPVEKFPLIEPLVACVFFTFMGFIMFYKNDRGEALTQRGLERYSPRSRKAISLLALIGLTSALTFAVNLGGEGFLGLYTSTPPRAVPASGLSDLCDIPASGVRGTRYGPCPGEPGYVLHLRKLPKTGG